MGNKGCYVIKYNDQTSVKTSNHEIIFLLKNCIVSFTKQSIFSFDSPEKESF